MNRPMFQATGEQVIAGITAGDPIALDEATHRSNRKVQAALLAHKGTPVDVLIIPAPVVKAAQTAAEKRQKALKARATAAFQAAFDAAPEGQKRRAGSQAYRKVLHG